MGLNVEDGELNKVRDSCKGMEGRTPIDLGGDLACLQRLRVEKLDRISNTNADSQWTDIA